MVSCWSTKPNGLRWSWDVGHMGNVRMNDLNWWLAYPLFFFIEFLIGVLGAVVGAFMPRRCNAEWFMNVAAVVAFFWLAFRVVKRSLSRTSSGWESFLSAALGVILFLFFIAVLTLPISGTWESLIQGRYAFESDAILDYTPFRPPAIAYSVLDGNRWVDYGRGGWNIPATPGSQQIPKSALYALWATLTCAVYSTAWLLYGWIWNLIKRRIHRPPNEELRQPSAVSGQKPKE